MLPKTEGRFDRPSSVISVDLDRREYNDNHKMIIAAQDTRLKDRISADFSRYNLPPKQDTNYYMPDTDNIDWGNFTIIDPDLA
jgi:hypothetical protein